MAPVLAVGRYEVALLLRGRRWLPPLLLLGFVLVTATAGGPPAGDALAFAAAALVPVCAWMTRVVLLGDPAPARACLMAAAGPGRTQAGCLLAAAVAATVTALLATAAVAGMVVAGGAPGALEVLAATVASGLITALTCALVGVALGALANPPVVRRADTAVLATGVGVVLALVAAASPAHAAIRGLSRTPRTAVAPVAWQSLAVVLVLLLLSGAVSVRAARRRGVH